MLTCTPFTFAPLVFSLHLRSVAVLCEIYKVSTFNRQPFHLILSPLTSCRSPLASCRSPLASYRLPLASYRLPLASYRLPLAARLLPLAARLLPLAARRSPLAARRSPLAARLSSPSTEIAPDCTVRIFVHRQRLGFHLDAVARRLRRHVAGIANDDRVEKMFVQMIDIFDHAVVQ